MPEQRDNWDKIEIIGRASSAIVAGVFVTIITLIGKGYFEERGRAAEAATLERQQKDANARLLAELISKREEAESALRKDMFGHIIKEFLTQESSTEWEELGRQVLHLEILTYNFHNALDLGPLFQDLNLRIHQRLEQLIAESVDNPDDDFKADLARLKTWADRVQNSARDVNGKQVSALNTGNNSRSFDIYFDELAETKDGVLNAFEREEILDYTVSVEILEISHERKQVRVKLKVWYPKEVPREPEPGDDPNANIGGTETVPALVDPDFWVGFFDFPMIDNTRLPDGRRMAVVLEKFAEQDAQLILIFFDGSRASLKDRPYYEEVFKNLKSINELTEGAQPE